MANAAEHKALAKTFFQHVGSKRIGSAAELLAPDFVFHAPGFPDLRGPKEWQTLTEQFYANSPNLTMQVDEQIAEGNTVVTRVTWQTLHEREFMGLPPTGKRLVVQSVVVHHMNDDGQIVEEFVMDDYLGMIRQLGALPLNLLQEKMDVPGGLGVRSVPIPEPR
jgi:steroid delta-isomerase-like uncharacterized protein